MKSVLIACDCEHSFNYHVPQNDGIYTIHCPNCTKKLKSIEIFDEGNDYEVIINPKEPETRYYVIELEGGKFLEDVGDEWNRSYYSVDSVWMATHFPHDEVPPFDIGEGVCIDNEGDIRNVVAVHEAFLHLVKVA